MKSAPEGIEIYPIFVSDQSRQYMRTLISILWISFFPLAAAAQDDDLSYRLKKVIKDKKAEIGIAVILDAQDTVTVNNYSGSSAAVFVLFFFMSYNPLNRIVISPFALVCPRPNAENKIRYSGSIRFGFTSDPRPTAADRIKDR